MKKLITISLLASALAATSAFGQGYFQFTSGKSGAWDGFTGANAAVSSHVDTAFLWAAASTTPAVDTLTGLAGSPTSGNSNTVVGASLSASAIWASILGGRCTFKTNSATGVGVVQQTSTTGLISYNSGVSFGVSGTAPSTTYTVYEIGWNAAFANPYAAAAAGSAVGWSAPFQYTSVTQTGFVNSMPTSVNFGVFVPLVTPEPTTLALAGLSGASLLLFRRRK